MSCINIYHPDYIKLLSEIDDSINPFELPTLIRLYQKMNNTDKIPSVSEIYEIDNRTKSQEIVSQIQDVFNENPELSKIGTVEQYASYLNTIFPDSKVKDIVYHGSKNKNEVLNSGFSKEKVRKDKESGKSLFEFTTSKIYAKQQGSVVFVIINAKSNNVLEEATLSNGAKAIVYDDYFTVNNTLSKGDSEFGISKKEMQERGVYYTVFEPEQIHILGSKADIQGFKDFVGNQNILNQETSLNNQYNQRANASDETIDRHAASYFTKNNAFFIDHVTSEAMFDNIKSYLSFHYPGIKTYDDYRNYIFELNDKDTILNFINFVTKC